MNIRCRFCDKDIDVCEYDFARWCKGELIYCGECYEDFTNNKNKIRRC